MLDKRPIIAAFVALGLTTPLAAQSLPGVSDEETTIDITSRGIAQVEFGKGDIAFVRDGINRWYRVRLTKGCLSGNFSKQDPAIFDSGAGDRIDQLTTVRFPRNGRICGIDSIRRSERPKMVDSKSRVPLD